VSCDRSARNRPSRADGQRTDDERHVYVPRQPSGAPLVSIFAGATRAPARRALVGGGSQPPDCMLATRVPSISNLRWTGIVCRRRTMADRTLPAGDGSAHDVGTISTGGSWAPRGPTGSHPGAFGAHAVEHAAVGLDPLGSASKTRFVFASLRARGTLRRLAELSSPRDRGTSRQTPAHGFRGSSAAFRAGIFCRSTLELVTPPGDGALPLEPRTPARVSSRVA